jgi:hypothetical protein
VIVALFLSVLFPLFLFFVGCGWSPPLYSTSLSTGSFTFLVCVCVCVGLLERSEFDQNKPAGIVEDYSYLSLFPATSSMFVSFVVGLRSFFFSWLYIF